MDSNQKSRISIQVSLGGYSFTVSDGNGERRSPWLTPDKVFTTQEFQRRYDSVSVSLLTPKFALVPKEFYSPEAARELLSDVADLAEGDDVSAVPVEERGAVLVYSNTIGESLSRVISQSVLTVEGTSAPVYPEIYYLLKSMEICPEYNKILCSYRDGYLFLVVAEGRTLLLCNVFKAVDFTTALYFIFLSLKRFQLNPEVSTIRFRTPVDPEEEMSLYRYFKSVEAL